MPRGKGSVPWVLCQAQHCRIEQRLPTTGDRSSDVSRRLDNGTVTRCIGLYGCVSARVASAPGARPAKHADEGTCSVTQHAPPGGRTHRRDDGQRCCAQRRASLHS